MFSSRLSLSTLIELCRTTRHYLGAGLTLPDVFRQQACRGPAGLRTVADRIAVRLAAGDSLADALATEAGFFPPILVSLAAVGEQTGMLPEVFADLERFFVRQQKLRRDFLARSAWPVIQFVLATFVLAGMLLILGLIAPAGSRPFDPLGLGLTGPKGAAIFLACIWGPIVLAGVVYFLMKKGLQHTVALDRFLLALPAVGPCLRALALARFCVALRLTTDTGMSIVKALRLSLRATGNGAFAAAIPIVEAGVREGDDLTLVLGRTGLLPDDFQHMLAVAEESGTLHDVLRHQAEHYQDEASRRLAVLTAVASYGVWLLTAAFIIIAIFRLYSSYLGLLDSFMPN